MVRCSRGSDWRRIRRRRNGGPLSQNSISAVAIPFATSIVTVLGSPQAERAQPRALIGGHLVATFIGLLIAKLFNPVPWAAAPAVGKEAATDAARAKLRRFANRAFRSGLLSRTVEMTAEPGPRRLARAERQRLLHLIPFFRDHRRVSSNLIALRCLHRGHFPQRGLPPVSERHRYAYGPGKRCDHTL